MQDTVKYEPEQKKNGLCFIIELRRVAENNVSITHAHRIDLHESRSDK